MFNGVTFSLFVIKHLSRKPVKLLIPEQYLENFQAGGKRLWRSFFNIFFKEVKAAWERLEKQWEKFKVLD